MAPLPRRPGARSASGLPRSGRPRGLPLAARAILILAIGALAGVMLLTAAGILPKVVADIGSALGKVTSAVFASPSPSPTAIAVIPPPSLVLPARQQTNQAAVTVTGSVPVDIAGQAGFDVVVYVATAETQPTEAGRVAVGATSTFVVPDVGLLPGRNMITARITSATGQSDASPAITYVLDTTKPKITISSPKNNSSVKGGVALISGKTKAGATVVARDAANGATAQDTADNSGNFALQIAVQTGPNAISLTATDPAGNVGTSVLSLLGGSGKLTVALQASAYSISAAKLPVTITLTATVTDPTGKLLANQLVTFTLGIHGLPQVTNGAQTNKSGVATFTTQIPTGATVGAGTATAMVNVTTFGSATGEVGISIVK